MKIKSNQLIGEGGCPWGTERLEDITVLTELNLLVRQLHPEVGRERRYKNSQTRLLKKTNFVEYLCFVLVLYIFLEFL